MRYRWISATLLTLAIALPACAQRRFSSGPRGGISIGTRAQGHIGFGGGISFGRSPRFGVFVNSRPTFRARTHYSQRYVYPYVSPYVGYSYAYPYAAYPAYPVTVYPAYPTASYDSNSYVEAAPSSSSSAYRAYPYGQEAGLAEQMRQQRLGVYANQPQPATAPATQPAPAASAPEPDLPPTVLVYRDGHRTEVRNYGIVGQTLWVFTEERSHKIPLAQIDVEATRKANDERGIEFAVPGNPEPAAIPR